MKTVFIIIGTIELLLGAVIAIIGCNSKDTIMVIIGCMVMICGKIDLSNNLIPEK
jgi:hypothetical protein